MQFRNKVVVSVALGLAMTGGPTRAFSQICTAFYLPLSSSEGGPGGQQSCTTGDGLATGTLPDGGGIGGNLWPGATPTIATPAVCGDSVCQSGESASDCPSDCGGQYGTPQDPGSIDQTRVFSQNPSYNPGAQAAGCERASQASSDACPAGPGNNAYRIEVLASVPPAGPAPELDGHLNGRDEAQDRHRESADTAAIAPTAGANGVDRGTTPTASEPNVTEVPLRQGGDAGPPPKSEDHDETLADVSDNERTDPVNPVTGEFSLTRTDLAIEGVGLSFVLTRYYSSRLSYLGPLGHGWTHSYDQRLVLETADCGDRTIRWRNGEGGVVRFSSPVQSSIWRADSGGYFQLVENAQGYALTLPNGDTSHFDAAGYLVKLADRNSNEMLLAWGVPPEAPGGPTRLLEVIDTQGRRIKFTYGARGYLTELEVPSTGLLVTYIVDTNEDLDRVMGVSANDGGGGEAYEYLSGHADSSQYLALSVLDSACEAHCSAQGSECSGESSAQQARRHAINACVDDCFDPESCLSSCQGCGNFCRALPEYDECTNGAGGCLSTCNINCLISSAGDCSRRANSSDDDQFALGCGRQCGRLATATCQSSFKCHRFAWSLSVGSSAPPYGSVTDEGNCFGVGNCGRAGWINTYLSSHDFDHPSAEDWLSDTTGWDGYPPTPEFSGDTYLPTYPVGFGGLSTSCDYDCYDCAVWGLCPQGSAARGTECVEKCSNDLFVDCLAATPPACSRECGNKCDVACGSGCADACTDACASECNNDATCRATCTDAADIFTTHYDDSCMDACRGANAPPTGYEYGRLSELNHNLWRIKRVHVTAAGEQEVTYVENTYEEDPGVVRFDRVIRHEFGGDGTTFRHYDLTRLDEAPFEAGDEGLVVATPEALEICPRDCGSTGGVAPGERWIRVGNGLFLSLANPIEEDLLGGVVSTPWMDLYGWYELSGSTNAASLSPAVSDASGGFRLLTDLGEVLVSDNEDGTYTLSGLDEPSMAQVFGDIQNLSVTLTRGDGPDWKAAIGNAQSLVRIDSDSACDDEVYIEIPVDEGGFGTSIGCTSGFVAQEVGRRPGKNGSAVQAGGESRRYDVASGGRTTFGGIEAAFGDPCFDMVFGSGIDAVCEQMQELMGDPSGLGPDCGVAWPNRGAMQDPGMGFPCTEGEMLPEIPGSSCDLDDYSQARVQSAGHIVQNITRATLVISDSGSAWTYYGDEAGRAVRVVTHDAAAPTQVDRNFDARGRLVGVQSPAGIRSCMIYDEYSNMVQATTLPTLNAPSTQARIRQRYTWSPRRQLIAVHDPNQPSQEMVQYGYDSAGINITSITYPRLGNALLISRDGRGRVDDVTGPDGTVTHYDFDASTGLVNRTTHNFAGPSDQQRVVETPRDGHGRVYSVLEPEWSSSYYGRSSDGRLKNAFQVLDPIAALGTIEVVYDYDGAGRLASITTPDGRQEYRLNERGLIETLQRFSSAGSPISVSCFDYDSTGVVVESVDPLGTRTHYERFPDGQIQRIYKGIWASSGAAWDTPCQANADPSLAYTSEVVLRIERDAYGRPVMIERGEPNLVDPWQTRMTYDGFGRVVEVENGGARRRTAFDARSRVVAEGIFALGAGPMLPGLNSESLLDFSDGNLLAGGEVDRDDLGRVTLSRQLWFDDDSISGIRTLRGPVGGFVESQTLYNDGAREVTYTDARGTNSVTSRDPLGRLVLQTLDQGLIVSSWAYAQHGREVTQTVNPTPSGSLQTVTTYTAFGGLSEVSETGRAIPSLTNEFDALGRLFSTTDRMGRREFGYDNSGRLADLWRVDEQGARHGYLGYVYDAADNVLQVADADGAKWTQARDALGRVRTQSYPGGGSDDYLYRPGTSAVRQLGTRSGDVRSFFYDIYGGLRRVQAYQGNAPYGWNEVVNEFSRGPLGLNTATSFNKASDPSDDIVLGFQRNSLGLPTQLSNSLFSGDPLTITRDLGLGSSDIATADGTISASQDTVGRLSQVRLDQQVLADFGYGGAGSPEEKAYGSGLQEDFLFDSVGRSAGSSILDSNGGSLLSFALHYSDDDRLSRFDQIDAQGVDSTVFGHDDFGRLDSAGYGIQGLAEFSGSVSPGDIATWQNAANGLDAFTHDSADNWTSADIDGVSYLPSQGTDHRLLSFGGVVSTDGAGSITSDPSTGSTYGYDGLGRLVQANLTSGEQYEFLNDAFGRLGHFSASPTEGSTFQWMGQKILREVPLGDKPRLLYIPGGAGGPLATQVGSDLYYHHYGYAGRIAATTDAAGGLVERYQYSAFGQPKIHDASGQAQTHAVGGFRLLTTGQPWFPKLGMHRYGVRWYAPHMGRFVSPDPMGMVDGPNVYRYALSSPVMFVDPWGLAAEDPWAGFQREMRPAPGRSRRATPFELADDQTRHEMRRRAGHLGLLGGQMKTPEGRVINKSERERLIENAARVRGFTEGAENTIAVVEIPRLAVKLAQGASRLWLRAKVAYQSRRAAARVAASAERHGLTSGLAQGSLPRPDGLLSNQLPGSLADEVAKAASVGVQPTRAGAAGFDELVNEGPIKWVITESGDLLVGPHTRAGVEISHAVLSGGAPVRAAGQANIAATSGQRFGIEISAHSGHFLNGMTRSVSERVVELGKAAFSQAGVLF